MLGSPGSRAARSLAIAGREALAFAKQAWLLRHDTAAPVLPVGVGDGEDVVVLLHGLFATAGVTRPIRKAITRHPGIHAAALSYAPGPGVAVLAGRVGALVRALPARARVHLVGHSLGGIVARYFAQEMGDERVVQTISIASPFAGVPRARLLGLECARDIEPASPLLRQLVVGGSADGLPHLSIIGTHDEMVRAPLAHALPGGEVVVLDGLGHNSLLFDPGVASIIERRILQRRAAVAA